MRKPVLAGITLVLALGALALTGLWSGTHASSDLSALMVDLSSNEADVVIKPEMKAELGIQLFFYRATLGAYEAHLDTDFHRRIGEANGHFDAGAYVVAYGKYSGLEQGQQFVDAVSANCVAGQRILLAVDWEGVCKVGRSCPDGDKIRVEPNVIADIIREIKRQTHVPGVLVYTDLRTLAKFPRKIPPEISDNPLWIATYIRRFYTNQTPAQFTDAVTAAHTRGKLSDKELKAELKDLRAALLQQNGRLGYIFPVPEEVAPWTNWMFWQYGSDDKADIHVGPTANAPLDLQNRLADKSYFNGDRADYAKAFDHYAWTCPARSN